MSKQFFRFENAKKDGAAAAEATLYLYEEIGFFGTMAKDFAQQLRGIEAKRLNIRVNSPGGSVTDGLAIRNLLKAHPAEKVFYVDGIAASIASVIITAGRVVMAPNALIFVHNPLVPMVMDANAEDLRRTADDLDKIRESIAYCYAAKTGADSATIGLWMDDETYFTADEAIAAKLADEIGEESPAATAVAFANNFPRLAALNNQTQNKMTPEEQAKFDELAAKVAELSETIKTLTATEEAEPSEEEAAKAKEAAEKAVEAKIAEAIAKASDAYEAKLTDLKAKIPAAAAFRPEAAAKDWRAEYAAEPNALKRAEIWRKNNA